MTTTKRERVIWRCQVCGQPIDDDDGYVEVDRQAAIAASKRLRRWEAERPPGSTVDMEWAMRQPERVGWRVLHRGCDPAVEGYTYWIGVERWRTLSHTLNWCAHLSGKGWFGATDFAGLCHRAEVETPAHQ